MLLVPITTVAVEYTVATGTPIGAVSSALLAELGRGPKSLQSLATQLGIHSRIAVDALLSLMRVGALEMLDDGTTFRLSAAGKSWATREDIVSRLFRDTREAWLARNDVTGQYSELRMVDWIRSDEVGTAKTGTEVQRLAAVVPWRFAEASQLLPHLFLREGEWLVSVANSTVRFRGSTYAIAKPVFRNGELCLDGVPSDWAAALLSVEETRDEALSRGVEATHGPDVETDDDEAPVFALEQSLSGREPFVVGAKAHWQLMVDTLECEAETFVVMHSAFLSSTVVERLLGPLERAVRRGVDVWLAYGYAGSQGHPKEALEKLTGLERRVEQADGTLVVRHGESGSHAKLLAYDNGRELRAVVGSYNWLSAGMDGPLEISARCRQSHTAASILRFTLTLVAGGGQDGGWIGRGPGRSASAVIAAPERSAAAGVEASNEANARVLQSRLVLDLQHDTCLSRAIMAEQRVLCCSHKLGPRARVMVVPPMQVRKQPSNGCVKFIYSEVSAAENMPVAQDIIRMSTDLGARWLHRSGVHAKVLIVGDDRCVVTSHNWLSTPISTRSTFAQEIGVELVGPEIGKMLRTALEGHLGLGDCHDA